DGLDQVRRADQGLARDASVVQALSPEPVPLDEGDLLAKLRGPDRRRITTRPASDDDDLEMAGHPPCERAGGAYAFGSTRTGRVHEGPGGGASGGIGGIGGFIRRRTRIPVTKRATAAIIRMPKNGAFRKKFETASSPPVEVAGFGE